MARQVHLVGSVGLRDAETVFSTVSAMLGSCCPRIPDGETGERGYWMRWQRNTFALNLGFEEVMTTRSVPGFNDNVARTFFTLRKDTDPERIELGELGYARAATDSYRIFTRLIDEGKVAADVRFQVSASNTHCRRTRTQVPTLVRSLSRPPGNCNDPRSSEHTQSVVWPMKSHGSARSVRPTRRARHQWSCHERRLPKGCRRRD